MTEPLGRVNVEIGADTSKLKAGVQEANTEVKKLDKSGDSLGKTMGKAQRVMSKIFMPVAIAGAVAGVTQKVLSLVTSVQNLRLGFQDTEKAARSMVENARLSRLSEDAREAVKIMREFDAQIEAVRKQAEDFKGSTQGALLGFFGLADADALAAESIRNIRIAQTQAEMELSRMRVEEARKVERERVALARQSAGRIFDAIDDIEIDLLPDAEQVARRYELTLNRLRDRLQDEGILNDAQVQNALRLYDTYLQRKRDKDLQALKEREQAEVESGLRVAKANADAMKQEMQRVQAELFNGFGFDFTSMEQVAAAGDRIAAAIDRNGGLR